PPEVSMVDNRTMAELLQAPTEGYEDAIVIPENTANNFELKHGGAWIWLKKEPPRSILTWEDLVTKFINQFFPPSKTINLRNEITRFQQRFDESFYEAWDHFNDLLRACPHHGFSELHQLDTFYNALNVNDQDSLNSAAVVAKVSTSSSTPSISSEVPEIKDMVRALLLDKKKQSSAPTSSSTPASVKAYVSQAAAANYNQGNTGFRPQMVANQIRPPGFPPYQNHQNNFNRGNKFNQNQGGNFNQSNFNQGGNFNQGQLYRPQVNQPSAYQALAYQAPIPQTQSMTQTDFEIYIKANDAVLRNMQSQGQCVKNQCQGLQTQIANLTDMLSKFVSSNTASSSGSVTLPSNTITNPKEDLKGLTTQSGAAYQGPTIPTQFKVMKQGTEVTKDQVQTPSSQSTAPVQPPVIQSKTQNPVYEPVVAPVSVSMPNLRPSIPYPSRHDNERRRDQANEQIEKFYEIFKEMSFEISFTDALILMPKFASTLKSLIENKEKLSEMARTPMNEYCLAVILNKLPRKVGDLRKFLIPCEFLGMDECLALADLGASINLMPLSVWEGLSLPKLTPTFMTLELADRSISKPIGIAKDVSVKVGVFHFPADFVVVDFEPDPRVPLILGSPTPYDDPIVLTTSPTLTLFGDSDFLLFEEADAFLSLEDDPNSPKFNPFYYDSEGDILLLEAILNSEPLPLILNHKQYTPSYKKELKVCEAKTVKSSVDEPPEVVLKDLPPCLEYAFLEGDNKLPVIIAKELGDKEKSALINVLKSQKRVIAWKLSDIQGINTEFCTHKILMEEDYKPAIQHQRRVNPKIHDVIKKEVEKLLDAGLIYPISDSPWVSPVHCVPKKGGFTIVENEENELIPTRLVTGWYFQILIDPRDQEKTTFTCPYRTFAYRRIPFGLCNAPDTFQRCMLAIFHDMVEKTMEVFMDEFSVFGNSFENCLSRLDKKLQRAKVDVIAKLPHPTTVKGAVLRQRHEKHFKPIHYASKMMNDAESNYTTTEKEMLAIVYAFEKFRSYLIMNKSIVHTDHSALKYLFAKKDAKARLLCIQITHRVYSLQACVWKDMPSSD
nr:hypothetical protein [Tanacetum cinerariifolium]